MVFAGSSPNATRQSRTDEVCRNDLPHAQVQEAALERHFSIKEIAEIWGLCENSVRDIFKNEPGVVRIHRPPSRYKRAYTTIRIPQGVVERVHRRMSLVA